MTNIKTLAIAALTVLTIGGTAMAQEGPTVDFPNNWAATPQSPLTAPYAGMSAPQSVMPQAGSSDVAPVPAVGYQRDQDVAASPGG